MHHRQHSQNGQSQCQDADRSREGSTNAVEGSIGNDALASLHPARQAVELLAQSGLVSAAALAALKPGVLPPEQLKPMLECLTKLAMEAPHAGMRQAAMVAAAVVVNKWPAGQSALMCNGQRILLVENALHCF